MDILVPELIDAREEGDYTIEKITSVVDVSSFELLGFLSEIGG